MTDFRKLRKGLVVTIISLSSLFALQLVLSYVVLPRMRLGQILLESSLDLPDEELLALGGITGRENFLSVDEQQIAAAYERSPLIRRAYVEKQFPNTLKIVLYGRNALGVTSVDGNRITSYFDEYGVVYSREDRFMHKDLPVLSGVAPAEDGLPESLGAFLKDLRLLQTDAPLLYDQISEIVLIERSDALYDLKMYLNAYELPVVLSAELSEGLMKKILLVLDSLNKGNLSADLEYADFRTEQVVLKTREGR